MPTATQPTSISYGTAPLNSFKIDERDNKGHAKVMTIEGRKVTPTSRFWTSLCSQYSNYGLTTRLFTLFPESDVFDRITQRLSGRDRLRYALEEHGAGFPTLLAVTNPTKPVLDYERVRRVLTNYGAPNAEYGTGIIRSKHTPAHMDNFEIGGDNFSHGYVLETPIDGFGKPLIYLSLLRAICSNGAIGYARAFRTEIQIGRGNETDNMFSITRCLDSFNNEEGYASLRSRFEAATQSWASIYECGQILKVLNQMAQNNKFEEPNRTYNGQIEGLALRRSAVLGGFEPLADPKINPATTKIIRAATQLSGDLCAIYGVAHLDAISEKKMRKLPTRCTVYDLLNFTTEVATHWCNEQNGRYLQAVVGTMISAEYDLELSASQEGGYKNFQDWFLSTSDIPDSDDKNPSRN